MQLRCVDDQPESEQTFGNQLWYFEGIGVDGEDRRHNVFGVVEYSVQFGLHELVEDGVFDSDYERERFRHQYNREVHRPSWRHPAHRWLLFGVLAIASACLAFVIVRTLISL